MPEKKPKATKKSAPAKATKKAAGAKKQTKTLVDKLDVCGLDGKSIEAVVLDTLFSGEANQALIYQAVIAYQAAQRLGTASTKDRSEVSGGGKKPWRQKGTGQARHGSNRSPIWEGGGVTFGPKPRDYSYNLPAKLRKRAVVEVIKAKAVGGELRLLEKLAMKSPKTKEFAKILTALKLKKPLFVVEKKEKTLLLASRNIPGVAVKNSDELNALDLALHRECLMTKEAYKSLIKRLKS